MSGKGTLAHVRLRGEAGLRGTRQNTKDMQDQEEMKREVPLSSGRYKSVCYIRLHSSCFLCAPQTCRVYARENAWSYRIYRYGARYHVTEYDLALCRHDD